MDISSHIGRSIFALWRSLHVCFFRALGLSTLSIPLVRVGGWDFVAGYESTLLSLRCAGVVKFLVQELLFLAHVYKRPLALCLITSCCRHSRHCCLKLPDGCLHRYRTLIRMWVRCPHQVWFRLEYSCHVVSSFCVFVHNIAFLFVFSNNNRWSIRYK
jgi:hypothetical protein